MLVVAVGAADAAPVKHQDKVRYEYFGYDAWGNRYRHDIVFREEMRTNTEEVIEAIEEMTAEGENDGTRRLGRIRKNRSVIDSVDNVEEIDGFGSISDDIRGDIVVVEIDSNRNLERELIREQLVAEGEALEDDTTFYTVRFYFDESPFADFDEMVDYFSRGYTGHEHMDMFGLINMNGRMYDPIIGRMLSPNPYVPNGTYTQDFNRYMYARNNPLSYIDPDGEFIIPALLFFTNAGYEVQKYISPIAFKVNWKNDTEVKGFGYDVSVGMPKGWGVSYRQHWGSTNYRSYYDNSYIGRVDRKGGEWTFGGLLNYSGTKISSGDISQTTNMITLGIPGFNYQYENDYLFNLSMPGVPKADGGDRYRTAAAKINIGIISFSTSLFTGDPGLRSEDREKRIINGREAYVRNEFGDDPDKYRSGIFYIGVGPFRIGRNSEQIRHVFQNVVAHDWIMFLNPSPYFIRLDKNKNDPRYRRARWYWGFNTGTGNSLW